MTRALILAVDGGQTSTKAVLARRDGTILAQGRGTPCDHIHGPNGVQRNRDAIHSAARSALAAAGRDASEIVAVGLGLTSAPREGEASGVFRDIVRELCEPEAIWVDADFVTNLYGASAGAPGVVVIAGGGSVGYGVDPAGREAVSGGLGYLMGDDGSAWYIGLRAIQAAAKASDQRGEPTALLPFVLEHYRLRTVRDIIRIIYDKDFTRDQVSAIAPNVVRIAREDAIARQIVTGAGDKLAEIALGAIRQLHAVGDIVDVYPTGGVFAAGALLTEPFKARLGRDWPTATIHTPRFPPVIGSFLQAIRALGDDVTPDVLARIEATL